MTFTVPNEADAGHEAQAELDAVDIAELVEGFAGTGVVSGGVVTEDSVTPDQTVEFTTVTYQIAGTTYTATGASVTCSDATAFTTGYEAWDLIVANTSSAVVLKAGTPAAVGLAVFPALDANTVLLAAVYRTEGDNTIVDADIVQKQVPRFLAGDATGDLYLDANRLYGGRTDGETLDLQGNSADAKDSIRMLSPVRMFPSGMTFAAAADAQGGLFAYSSGTLTLNYSSWTFGCVGLAGTVVWAVAPALFAGPNLFAHSATHKNPNATAIDAAAVANVGIGFADVATWQGDGAAFTLGTITGFQAQPTLNRINSGTITAGTVNGFISGLTASAGSTITNRYGMQINSFSGSGTVTSQCGIAITGMASATNNTDLLIGTLTIPSGSWAIYSSSTSRSSFIGGPIRLGTTTGPLIRTGSGTPEAAVTAPVGSLFLRTDGGASTTLYVKESGTGNTGWVAK